AAVALALAPAAGAAPALSPLDLDFAIVAQFRPFDLLPRPFVEVSERFTQGAAPRAVAACAGGPAERLADAGAALRLRPAGDAPLLVRSRERPAAPFATAIVTVPADGAAEGAVLAGLVRDGRHHVTASFDRGRNAAAGTVAIDVTVDGRRTRAAAAMADLSGIERFAFAVNENYVTALVERAGAWVPVVQHRVTALVDLRDPTVLSAYRYGFGAANAAIDVAAFEAGHFGEAGLRDPHVVSYADGTPYIRGTRLYFTATQAGLSFFQAAHWGVWTLDLDDPSRIEPVAKLFFRRDGLLLGDHAGQIVVDERGGGFHVAVSSWGDFAFKGVHVRYRRTTADILSGVHVLESARLPLPTDVSAWDPAMVRIAGRWFVGFVESPYQDPARGFDFHPALARSGRGAPPTRLDRVGADRSRGETEGVILQRIGGRWYLLASDGDDRRYRVYDLAMRPLGSLKAPYGTNIPHPQVVPVTREGRTSYLLITFNGTQYHEPVLGYGTHGDVIVMRARQTSAVPEFAPRAGGREPASRADREPARPVPATGERALCLEAP
ncbi:MAG TPA: hypothetical protein VFS03_10755, partial [Microvirga sp.]|nr:hypothetical protein [Microvirga sp.]